MWLPLAWIWGGVVGEMLLVSNKEEELVMQGGGDKTSLNIQRCWRQRATWSVCGCFSCVVEDILSSTYVSNIISWPRIAGCEHPLLKVRIVTPPTTFNFSSRKQVRGDLIPPLLL